MSTQATDAAGEDVEIETRPRDSGLSGKRLVLFILLPLLLLIGGGVTLQVTGLADDLLRGGAASSEEVRSGPSVFYELPELLVNLNSGGKRPNYLKLRVSLELTDAQSVHHIERVLPRIVDSFQVYLRELRIEDLRGSAGLYRLREELLLRVNAAAEPVVIRDVLFKEMLVQ
ncbi:flagellar basal body-associated FliL family protein [Rhodospirillaceae bacterium SYSU D60014]|uniref:flagellar basal body-associated FliL family protein n=1 Tax=Virgifigura deserti TaxID=2268457 RepID=UPI000E67078B